MTQITLTESQVRERAELVAIRSIVCEIGSNRRSIEALAKFKSEDPAQYRKLVIWDAFDGRHPDDVRDFFDILVDDIVTTMMQPEAYPENLRVDNTPTIPEGMTPAAAELAGLVPPRKRLSIVDLQQLNLDRAEALKHSLGEQDKPDLPHIIMVGNPVDGYTFIGPFPDAITACDYPDVVGSHRRDDVWHVTELEPPQGGLT